MENELFDICCERDSLRRAGSCLPMRDSRVKSGRREPALHNWDARTNTMTWTSEQDGFVTTVKSHFVDADQIEWDVLTKDAAGKTMFLMNGKSVRVKKAK